MRINEIEYVTASEAAKRLGVSSSRVRQLIGSEVLSGMKVGNMNFVTAASVEKYKATRKPPKGKPLENRGHELLD